MSFVFFPEKTIKDNHASSQGERRNTRNDIFFFRVFLVSCFHDNFFGSGLSVLGLEWDANCSSANDSVVVPGSA